MLYDGGNHGNNPADIDRFPAGVLLPCQDVVWNVVQDQDGYQNRENRKPAVDCEIWKKFRDRIQKGEMLLKRTDQRMSDNLNRQR